MFFFVLCIFFKFVFCMLFFLYLRFFKYSFTVFAKENMQFKPDKTGCLLNISILFCAEHLVNSDKKSVLQRNSRKQKKHFLYQKQSIKKNKKTFHSFANNLYNSGWKICNVYLKRFPPCLSKAFTATGFLAAVVEVTGHKLLFTPKLIATSQRSQAVKMWEDPVICIYPAFFFFLIFCFFGKSFLICFV